MKYKEALEHCDEIINSCKTLEDCKEQHIFLKECIKNAELFDAITLAEEKEVYYFKDMDEDWLVKIGPSKYLNILDWYKEEVLNE